MYNGCLLPFFYVCLLLCINDERFMSTSPQKGWANVCLLIGAFVTIVFTFSTLIDNMFHWLVSHHHTTASIFETKKIIASLIAAIVTMVILFLFTNLGVDVKRSMTMFFKRSRGSTTEQDKSTAGACVNQAFDKV